MSESYCQGLSLTSYCSIRIGHWLIYPVCGTFKTVQPVLTLAPTHSFGLLANISSAPPHGSMDYRLSDTDIQLTHSKSLDLYREGEDRKV